MTAPLIQNANCEDFFIEFNLSDVQYKATIQSEDVTFTTLYYILNITPFIPHLAGAFMFTIDNEIISSFPDELKAELERAISKMIMQKGL